MNSPIDVISYVDGLSVKKNSLPTPKLILLSILAGMYIALGGALSQFVSAGFSVESGFGPGVGKFLSGVFFPIGLILIVLVGGELFTGNVAYMVVGVQRKMITFGGLLRNWVIVYLFNFLGALLFAYFFVYQCGLLHDDPWQASIVGTGMKKVGLTWGTAFLKGIAANWLVCLALWLGYSAKDMLGRVVGIWIPVMAFVTMGYEHSIANMFYLPMAMMSGADIGISEMITSNLIPVTLGNIVGGGLFVGAAYAYLYGRKNNGDN